MGGAANSKPVVVVAKQQGLPMATFVAPPHQDDATLPQAVPVVVVDAASIMYPPALGPPPTATATDIPDPEAIAKHRRRQRVLNLLLLLSLAVLGSAVYLVYHFAIEPTLASSSDSSSATSTWAPTPPTTWSPTGEVYGIDFVFAPSPTPVPTTIRTVFEQARRKWQTILVEPGTSPRLPANSMLCNHAERTYDGVERIDDLEIWVDVAPIDGVGGILGYSRPCGYVAEGTFRSVTGEMVFDVDDLEKLDRAGTLLSVITHELGHVLGLGSYWNSKGLVRGPGYVYTGEAGKRGYELVGGTPGGSPPIELDGGEGTAYSHWDEDTFKSELMTGYITSGNSPLSKLTVLALQDLGYTVNEDMADSYVMPVEPGAVAAVKHLRTASSSSSSAAAGAAIPPQDGEEHHHRRHSQLDEDFMNSQPQFPLRAV